MLQLKITVSTQPGVIILTDDTPAYNAQTAPGGYGGPNPLANEVALLMVAARYRAGSSGFDMTFYSNGYSRIVVDSDGVYQFFVLAAPIQGIGPTTPKTLWRDLAGSYYVVGSTGASIPLMLSNYDYDALRTLDIIVLNDFLGDVVLLDNSKLAVDRLLLEYVRQASRNRPQRGEDYAAQWVQSFATLESIKVLRDNGRYAEAAANLAALSSLVVSEAPETSLRSARRPDWIREQTA